MVLFVLEHIMALSQSIALRYTRFENETCTLVINNDFANSEYANKMINKSVFNKIIRCNKIFGTEFDNEYNYINGINNYYSNIFNSNNINLQDYSNIIVAADEINTTSIYFHLNNIKHDFIELFEDQFKLKSRYNILNTVSNGNCLFARDIHIKYSALTGESELVNKRYLYSNTKDEIIDEKDEIIDFMKLFYSIDVKYKNILKEIFGSINIKHNNNLFLFSSKGRTAFSKHPSPAYYCYQIMCDYYSNDNAGIILKDHPNSNIGEAEKIFDIKNVQFLDKSIPLEFFALDNNFYIDQVVSVATTTTQKIKPFIGNNIDLQNIYFSTFTLTHKLYTVYALDKFLGICRSYFYFGIDKTAIENVKKIIFDNKKPSSPIITNLIKGDTFNVIDNISQEEYENIYNSLKNTYLITKIIFINSNKSFDFLNCFDESLLQYLIPFTIKKKKLRNNTICDIKDEMIYVFCKSTEIREKIRTFTFEKSLKFTGIEIFVNPMTELEIKEQQDILRPIMNSKITK